MITLASGDLQSNGSQQNMLTGIRPTSVLNYESLNDRTDAHRNHSTIIVLPSMNLTTIFGTENSIQPRQMRSLPPNKIILSIRPTPVAPTQTHTSFELGGFHQSAIKRNAHDSLNHLKHEHRKRVEVTITIMIHNISVAVDEFNDAENRPESSANNVNRFVFDFAANILRFLHRSFNSFGFPQKSFEHHDNDDNNAIGQCIESNRHHLYGAGEWQICIGGYCCRRYGTRSRYRSDK